MKAHIYIIYTLYIHIYIYTYSKVKCHVIYICQAPLHFQFTKKLNNWNSEKIYLVVCGCLLVVCGCLLVVCGILLVVFEDLLVVCGHLLVICCSLWLLPVLVTTDFVYRFDLLLTLTNRRA